MKRYRISGTFLLFFRNTYLGIQAYKKEKQNLFLFFYLMATKVIHERIVIYGRGLKDWLIS